LNIIRYSIANEAFRAGVATWRRANGRYMILYCREVRTLAGMGRVNRCGTPRLPVCVTQVSYTITDFYVPVTCQSWNRQRIGIITRVGTLIVATIYLQLIQN